MDDVANCPARVESRCSNATAVHVFAPHDDGRFYVVELLDQYRDHRDRSWRVVVRYSTGPCETYIRAEPASRCRPVDDPPPGWRDPRQDGRHRPAPTSPRPAPQPGPEHLAVVSAERAAGRRPGAGRPAQHRHDRIGWSCAPHGRSARATRSRRRVRGSGHTDRDWGAAGRPASYCWPAGDSQTAASSRPYMDRGGERRLHDLPECIRARMATQDQDRVRGPRVVSRPISAMALG